MFVAASGGPFPLNATRVRRNPGICRCFEVQASGLRSFADREYAARVAVAIKGILTNNEWNVRRQGNQLCLMATRVSSSSQARCWWSARVDISDARLKTRNAETLRLTASRGVWAMPAFRRLNLSKPSNGSPAI